MSRTKIQTVAPGSPAHRAGVRPGETLAAINGHPIIDVLDYKFYSYDPDLVLTLREGDQERKVFLDKDVGQDLGLEFETYLMDRARSCANKCVFCFVDQMPKGMRDTLYFKDDDARLSFLMGNYITLTNLSKREIQRICDLHISPINISVHATDPEIRRELLGNKRRGGECLEIMQKFAQAGIVMNAQIVSCPGLNDGPVLQGGAGGAVSPSKERLHRPCGPDPVPGGAIPPAPLPPGRGPERRGPGRGLWGPVRGAAGQPDVLVFG